MFEHVFKSGTAIAKAFIMYRPYAVSLLPAGFNSRWISAICAVSYVTAPARQWPPSAVAYLGYGAANGCFLLALRWG